MSLSKSQLVNLAKPDSNIQALQSSNPKLYNAIKNLGISQQQVINTNYPRVPAPVYRNKLIIVGNPLVGNDILGYHDHIIMPIDPSNNWSFSSITLSQCYIIASVAPLSSTLSIDIKIQRGNTSTWKSLFQPGFNPILPMGQSATHNIKFAIDTLLQDDLLRVDILSTDTTVSGILLDFIGFYNLVNS